MRRSKAPSVLNKAKRICNSNSDFNEPKLETRDSDPEDEQYNWGSRNNNCEIKSNQKENKRIFTIVWRDVSTKKHKTWKGDGTLEVNNFTVKAVLKDEGGKYLGCSTKFNKNDLAPDFQMVIGGKEIEIQNEITDEDELHEVRKRQILNRNWGEDEWISPNDLAEEKMKPKGGFKFKPVLVLNPPETPTEKEPVNTKAFKIEKDKQPSSSLAQKIAGNNQNISLSVKENFKSKDLTNSLNGREFICFLRPSELQQFLFQKTMGYYSSLKADLTLDKIQTLDIIQVLQNICHHPSFINHKSTTNELIQFLIPSLPDWSEMGPFDSGKLEFVQYFLNDLNIKPKPQNCIILAKNSNVLNMLQGLCDFMNISCSRLDMNTMENFKTITSEFCSSEKNTCQVLLINSIEILKKFDYTLNCKKLIIFDEFSKNINAVGNLENVKNLLVYYLVTSCSIEELSLMDTYKNYNKENILELCNELVKISNTDTDYCYLHLKIECNCFENLQEVVDTNNTFVKNWQHFKNPFSEELLKISSLENSAQNIVMIFCKNINFF